MARAAAHATGLPPKVEPWVPVGHRSSRRRSATMPPSGSPDAMPLANSSTSGVTPYVSAANGRPVRPTPHCTSSNTSRMPCVVAAVPQALRATPAAGRRSRPRPARARRSSPPRWRAAPAGRRAGRARRARRRRRPRRSRARGGCSRERGRRRAAAARSPRGSGPWPWSASWPPRVRPWNARRNAITPGRPVTFRASLSAPSTASAPELQKNTCGSSRNGHRRAEPLGQLDVAAVVHDHRGVEQRRAPARRRRRPPAGGSGRWW